MKLQWIDPTTTELMNIDNARRKKKIFSQLANTPTAAVWTGWNFALREKQKMKNFLCGKHGFSWLLTGRVEWHTLVHHFLLLIAFTYKTNRSYACSLLQWEKKKKIKWWELRLGHFNVMDRRFDQSPSKFCITFFEILLMGSLLDGWVRYREFSNWSVRCI